MSLSPKMIGLAKFAAKVELQRTVRRALLQKHFEREGAAIVDEIKAAVAVDRKTGTLEESVRCVPAEKKPGVLITAGGTAGTARQSKGVTYDEALLLEYGTRREAARPYFYPTLEQQKRGLVDRITGAMKTDK